MYNCLLLKGSLYLPKSCVFPSGVLLLLLLLRLLQSRSVAIQPALPRNGRLLLPRQIHDPTGRLLQFPPWYSSVLKEDQTGKRLSSLNCPKTWQRPAAPCSSLPQSTAGL